MKVNLEGMTKMNSIANTVELIKYFELAIVDVREAIYSNIRHDKEYLTFKKKCLEKYGFTFMFCKHALNFEFFDVQKGYENLVGFFTISRKGEISYDSNNTFKGIEEVAKEAQKIVSKFL